jgi:hypothetical protein
MGGGPPDRMDHHPRGRVAAQERNRLAPEAVVEPDNGPAARGPGENSIPIAPQRVQIGCRQARATNMQPFPVPESVLTPPVRCSRPTAAAPQVVADDDDGDVASWPMVAPPVTFERRTLNDSPRSEPRRRGRSP